MSAHEFCDLCGVSMDLHPWPPTTPSDGTSCVVAEMKAQTLEQFDRIFARGSM